jgi:Tripartite tricarboxylate transporter family receptor
VSPLVRNGPGGSSIAKGDCWGINNLDFDPVKDFAPVAALATESLVLVVHPSVPAATLAELVRYAKENPGKLTSGATVGIAPHLLLEFLRARTGADIVFVPYKGAAPAITDVLGGQIQIHVSAKSVLLPLIKSEKLRALAVTSAQRWPRASIHHRFCRGEFRGMGDGLVRQAWLEEGRLPPQILHRSRRRPSLRPPPHPLCLRSL